LKATTVAGVIWYACLAMAALACADVSDEIARIEALPRTKRLAEYETLADRRSLSNAERAEVIKAFAKHAARLSPVYGRSTHKIDAKRWQQMLEYAHQQDPRDHDVAWALIQLLIDQKKYEEALPFCEAFARTHADNHFARASSQYCKLKTGTAASASLRTFPLHFCVITRNPQAEQRATIEQCQEEVETFNRSFVTLAGKSLVKFEFKGFSSFADVSSSSCELLTFGDSTQPYSNDAVTKAFNACQDPKVRDSGAVNVYIFDSHSEKAGFGDPTSHGIRNSNRPFMLIVWQRLGGNLQDAEPPEMGHCFGLGHVGVPGASGRTSTNIMASSAEGFGSGGQRDLGFSESQAALILYHAQRTHSRLGLK
jgi:hypothetical protein